ncbi:SMC-Scp complex subunit ScpB [Methanohalobium sp.]|uniref:SMC-Scp complex subunit ScpB n=1 Tax=Methanohalobium sp. TaxID=2837493 RepID=UPI0025FE846A|nr:SMC-Scp complex subunit ScpB [Methanohalobium sp.]
MANENKKLRDKQIIEAALFAAGNTVDIQTLTRIISKSKKHTISVVQTLIEEYTDGDTGLEILDLGERYVMQVKPEFSELVSKLAPRELSSPILRTLSMIAYHQPITQSDLVDLRGNSAYEHVKELQDRGFIRTSAYGRTKLLETTPLFVDYFGLESNDPESIKQKIIELSREQSGQKGLDRWLGRKVIAVTPMYESLMELCGIDDYRVINIYNPTEDDIDSLEDVYKLIIPKGYSENVKGYYDGEIIEVSSTTFDDLIESIKKLENISDSDKSQESIDYIRDLKDKYLSKALVISRKVKPETNMVARLVNDLRLSVSADGILIGPDYGESSDGEEIGKNADILISTHQSDIHLIDRVCKRYDTIINGLDNIEGQN